MMTGLTQLDFKTVLAVWNEYQSTKEFGMKKIIIEVTSDEQLTQVVEDLETYVFRGYDNPPNMYIEEN